jgi:hypothetical protein
MASLRRAWKEPWAHAVVWALLAVLFPAAASAQDAEDHGIEAAVDLVGQYNWRGWDLNHRDPAIQPDLAFAPPSWGGFWVDVWASLGLGHDAALGDQHDDLDEVDLTVGYDRDLSDRVSVELWGAWYENTSQLTAYETPIKNGRDFEAGVFLNAVLGPHAEGYVAYTRGLDEGIRGDYFEVDLAAPLALGSGAWSARPSVMSGLGNQFGADNRPMHLTFQLPIRYQAGRFAVVAAGNTMIPLQDLNDDGQKTLWFAQAGLKLAY